MTNRSAGVRLLAFAAAVAVGASACTRAGVVEVSATVAGANRGSVGAATSVASSTSNLVGADATSAAASSPSAPPPLASTPPTTDVATTVAETVAPTTGTANVAPPTSAPSLVDGPSVQGIVVPELGSGTTSYRVPTASPDSASWGDTHHDYPATDIFVPGQSGCGGTVTTPVTGVIVEVRREDRYDRAVDNPATRGGRSITIIGDDGVRYYMSHLDTINADLGAGDRVAVGDDLGTVGNTGRSGACHIHLGISPACAEREWSVRRGVIWPYPYLEDWRSGGQRSPVDEIENYLSQNPDACMQAAADPNAADA